MSQQNAVHPIGPEDEELIMLNRDTVNNDSSGVPQKVVNEAP